MIRFRIGCYGDVAKNKEQPLPTYITHLESDTVIKGWVLNSTSVLFFFFLPDIN